MKLLLFALLKIVELSIIVYVPFEVGLRFGMYKIDNSILLNWYDGFMVIITGTGALCIIVFGSAGLIYLNHKLVNKILGGSNDT
jgi:hypothetical protein